MILINVFAFFFLQAEFCTMFHARSAEITALVNIMAFTRAMDVLDFLSAPFDVAVSMCVNPNPMDYAWSIKLNAINVGHADSKNASRLE